MAVVIVLVLEEGLIDGRNEGPRYGKGGRIGMNGDGDGGVGWIK